MTLGDEGRIVYLQLSDLLAGVDFTKRAVLRDYIKPLRNSAIRQAMEDLSAMTGSDLEDPSRVGKEMGFPDLDDPADPRGYRLLSQVGRLPDPVRDDIIRHFGSAATLLDARVDELLGCGRSGRDPGRPTARIFRPAPGHRGRMGAGARLTEGAPTLRSR